MMRKDLTDTEKQHILFQNVARVRACVRVIAMCSLGLTIEFIPRRNLNLQLDAFCLDLSNPLLCPDTQTHTRAHTHTEPIHPSP